MAFSNSRTPEKLVHRLALSARIWPSSRPSALRETSSRRCADCVIASRAMSMALSNGRTPSVSRGRDPRFDPGSVG